MNEIIGLLVVVIGIYVGYHLIIAMFKGIAEGTDVIKRDGPGFFSKVFQSIIAGSIAGAILASVLGTESGIVGPIALGVAAVTYAVT